MLIMFIGWNERKAICFIYTYWKLIQELLVRFSRIIYRFYKVEPDVVKHRLYTDPGCLQISQKLALNGHNFYAEEPRRHARYALFLTNK